MTQSPDSEKEDRPSLGEMEMTEALEYKGKHKKIIPVDKPLWQIFRVASRHVILSTPSLLPPNTNVHILSEFYQHEW